MRNNREFGFSLVELLVAVALFSVVGGAALNIFISSLASQRNVFAQQVLIDQASLVSEYLSRAIRQATKDATGECILTGTHMNYEVSGGGKVLTFLDKENQCRELSFDGGANTVLERKSSSNRAANFGAAAPLFSNDVLIQDLSFFASGEAQTDSVQPRVTFFLEALGAGKKPEAQVRMQLQTTISQRRFDVLE